MPLSQSDTSGALPADELKRHHESVCRYLRYLGAPADRIDDLAQDTFAQACVGPFEWRSVAATRAWLRTIARNTFLRAARRRGLPMSDVAIEDLAATWERHCGEDDGEALLQTLRRCLQSLRERHRQALVWRYGEDRSVVDVGEQFGMGPAGADSLLTRIRRSLRHCIERNHRS